MIAKSRREIRQATLTDTQEIRDYWRSVAGLTDADWYKIAPHEIRATRDLAERIAAQGDKIIASLERSERYIWFSKACCIASIVFLVIALGARVAEFFR